MDLALTHRTWVEERHPGGAAPGHLSQQRLEFLGDAILNYTVGRWLYEALPTSDEGDLTERRKAFTKGEWLHQRGAALGLSQWVRLGRGEASSDRNRKLLEDTTEALLGAVAVDGGEAAAIALVRAWLPATVPAEVEGDPIALFNEWYQRAHRGSPPEPEYHSSGPDHARTWTARYDLDGFAAEGLGVGKQDAKRAACRELWALIRAR